jgi:hypothetical protein
MPEARRDEAELNPFRVPFTRKESTLHCWKKKLEDLQHVWNGPILSAASEMDTFRFTVLGLRELCACILNDHDRNTRAT